MTNLLYSAKHYQIKCAKDREAVEQIYEEIKKSSQNAIFRNIGDIFFTARTDTEINGAVECNGGTYSTADFEGKQNVGNLLASGSLPYVSLSEYESLVSANGSCRAFGWDGGNSFRVPTIPALLLTKEQSAVVGNGMTLGLTNGTTQSGLVSIGIGGVNNSMNNLWASVGAEGTPVSTSSSGSPISNYFGNLGVTADADKSGIVANLDVIEYRAMVQLANGATDQAVITATSALQQVANKVDKTSATDRETVVGWGMPDYSSSISFPTPYNNPYTAQANGWVFGYIAVGSGYTNKIFVNSKEVSRHASVSFGSLFPVSKGDIITTDASSGNFVFYLCIGA